MGFFDSIADAFSRDGSVTCFFEKIPVVGYGVAGVQALAGNGDHAMRAVASSTNSLITTAGAVGGMVIGGPPGAVLGGAAAAQLGMVTEFGISKTISDDSVKGDVGELSWKRVAVDGTLGGLTGMIGGGAGASSAGKVAGKVALDSTSNAMKSMGFKTMADVIAKNAGKEAAKAVTTGSLSAVAQGAGKGLLGSKPDSKDEPQSKKQKIRVVTKNQEERAKEVQIACATFKEKYPLPSIYDAFGSVYLYWDTTVLENLPWGPAYKAVQDQIQEFNKKKKDQPGQEALWKRADDELKNIVDLHNAGTQLTGGKAKMLAEVLKGGLELGFKFVQDDIQKDSMLIDFQLQSLHQLMLSEVKEIEV